ncbi:MAG: PQQ-dependent sugar dehydrogenase [Planctomycetota bacterium]|jgi:glucose/arabinose dehydrogenase
MRICLALLLLAGAATSQDLEFKTEIVARGLVVPWGVAFPDNDRIFVTERPGRVRVIEKGKLREKPLHTIDAVTHTGEAGLMDIQIHPHFSRNRWVYLSYSYRAGRSLKVRVVRFTESAEGLGKRKVIVDAIPTARFHAGCRLGFGPDGKLYVTTGDATDRKLAQKLDNLVGKTLRLEDDGVVPKDNPFVGKKGARPEIWSYGHRNAQGLAWQPDTDRMFQTEHGPSIFDGPSGGDEVNIVTRGANLGWPLVSHGRKKEGTVSPLLVFTPAVAPAGAVIYAGDKLKGARGNLFFGCLRGACLMRVILDGEKVIKHEPLLTLKYGRIREVAQGPDGHLYFTTSNRDGRARPKAEDDVLVRIVPRTKR